MRARIFLLLAALLPFGCIQDLLDAGAALSPDTDAASSSGTSTGGQPTPTTSAGSGVQTVTGPPGEPEETTGTTTSGTTGAPEENIPPTVELAVADDYLSEAGSTQLLLTASMDVVKVRLSMDGALLAELTPADFPYTYEALSAKDNGDPHVFVAEVEDAEGLTASDDAELTVQLPASGAQKCIFDKDKENPAVVMSSMSALVYTKTAIVGVGVRDTGAGKRMAIWKLDPDHCEETLPGWPKTIADWTDPKSDFDTLESVVTAVAVDEQGKIAIGGNLLIGGKPQRYTALLTPDGGRVWEKIGLVGEEVSSVVIVGDVVISGGWTFTSEDPPRTDAAFWRHLPDKTVSKKTLKAPLTADEPSDFNNLLSEWIRALLIDPDGYLVALGEREYRDGDKIIYTRAFIARFVPLGGPVGSPVTSPGDAYKHEAMYSIAVCGDELIAGGWTRDHNDPNAVRQPEFRWAFGGIWLEKKLLEPMPSTELRGAACDREGKVVAAGVRTAGGSDAKVFAFADPLGERTWYEMGTAGDDEANGVTCDSRGFCAWPGDRTVNGKKIAVVRVHHP